VGGALFFFFVICLVGSAILQDSEMHYRWRKSSCKGKNDPQTRKGAGLIVGQ